MTDSPKDQAIKALHDTRAQDQARTKIGRLREIYDELRESQRLGVSGKEIVRTLNKTLFRGEDISLAMFRVSMSLIARERKSLPADIKSAAPARAVSETAEPPSQPTAANQKGQPSASKPSQKPRPLGPPLQPTTVSAMRASIRTTDDIDHTQFD